jgi:hypothetical protein
VYDEFLSDVPLPGLERGYRALTLTMIVHLDAERDEWQIGWTLGPTGDAMPDESVALPPIKGVAAERSVLLRLHALLDRAYERLEPF